MSTIIVLCLRIDFIISLRDPAAYLEISELFPEPPVIDHQLLIISQERLVCLPELDVFAIAEANRFL